LQTFEKQGVTPIFSCNGILLETSVLRVLGGACAFLATGRCARGLPVCGNLVSRFADDALMIVPKCHVSALWHRNKQKNNGGKKVLARSLLWYWQLPERAGGTT